MLSNQLSLMAILEFEGTILCRTGLHIGGNMENFHISNLDSPVVRDTLTRFPYIPGSSFKGKVRALLELSLGKYTQNKGNFTNCTCNECDICRLFGVEAAVRLNRGKIKGPTRLAVQDAYPEGFTTELFYRDNPAITSGTTIERWENLSSGLLYTEWKKENSLDRITSAANPRDTERIPAGSKFMLRFSCQIFEEADIEALPLLMTGLQLLENSYLGGGGTRGYGKVLITIEKVLLARKDDLFAIDGQAQQLLPDLQRPVEFKAQIVPAVRQALGLAAKASKTQEKKRSDKRKSGTTSSSESTATNETPRTSKEQEQKTDGTIANPKAVEAADNPEQAGEQDQTSAEQKKEAANDGAATQPDQDE